MEGVKKKKRLRWVSTRMTILRQFSFLGDSGNQGLHFFIGEFSGK